jgi:unsaturated rhamnogalacturonyl hydrolase
MKKFYTMMKQRFFLAVFFSIFSIVLSAQTALIPSAVFHAMQKTANWQIGDIEKNGWHYPPTDWTNGAYFAGQMAWARMANDDRQINFLKGVGETNKWMGGPERFFADDYCVGQTYAELFMLYKDSAMIKPMIELGDDILRQPHTESLLWNFDGGLHNREWAWCDALFMGPPTLGYLYKVTGNKKYLDGMNKLWWKSTNFLYDTTEHLYFRDSRFFEKKEKNGAKVFWSRGNGWVIAGIARILNNMPANYSDRKGYEKIFKAVAKRVASLQQPDGTWHASLLDPASFAPKETSGTAFFAYALAWGINNGLLSYNEYYPTLKKSWEALIGCVHDNGKLGFVQVPGAAPETVTYDDTEVYGVGAFLLAGTELFKLLYEKENATKIIVWNSTATNRQYEMADIKWGKLAALKFSPSNTTLVNAQTGDEVPTQIIYNGKIKPQAIIFQSGTTIGSSAFFLLKKQQPTTYPPQTFGRLVPERMDDFAWENDRIAFRMYGPALQKTGEISNGIDVWAKRTKALVIDKWYKGDDYHHDHGEGLDFYGVGTTLGAGGVAPFINNKLYPSKNFISYKVLENGPLRTMFELNYATWNVAGAPVKETKTITLDAGSFFNKVEVKYSFAEATLPIAVGIAILQGEGKSWNEKGKHGLLAYQQPAQEQGTISLGVIIPQPCETGQIAMAEEDHYKHSGHYILKTVVNKNKLFTYYQGASWDKEGSFKSFDEWKQHLQQKLLQLNNALKITVHP